MVGVGAGLPPPEQPTSRKETRTAAATSIQGRSPVSREELLMPHIVLPIAAAALNKIKQHLPGYTLTCCYFV